MNKVDELIGRALSDEDRALLARHGEPGYLGQAFGMLRGPQSWVAWFSYFGAGIGFFAGAYAVWRMFGTTDALVAIRWAVAALFLFQVTLLSKLFLASRLETNRVLREVKRLELQVSLLRETRG